MNQINDNDITRLLSLEFNDLAGELGHTPNEAKVLVEDAIIRNTPIKVEGIIDDSILSGHDKEFNKVEFALLIDELKKYISNSSPYLENIINTKDLYCIDKDGSNILMYLVSDGHVLAVKYLLEFPFDLLHKDIKGYSALDYVRVLGADNQTNIGYRDNVRECGALIRQKLDKEPNLEYVLLKIREHPNFHQYEEIYDKVLISGDINEINGFGSTLLIKSATFGDVNIVRVLVDYGIKINHKNGKGETALNIAESMVINSPGTQLYEEIVEILNIKLNNL